VGAFETDPAKIAEIMAQWLSDPVELEHMKRRSKALGRPQAVYHIAEDLADLVEEGLRVTRSLGGAPAAAALAGAAVAV
jgi:1,2-diacylglycerol 3-beta-galactosyltransferase